MPDAPTTLRVTGVSTSSVTLAWNGQAELNGTFQIERLINDEFVNVGSTANNVFENVALAANTLYTFHVLSIGADMSASDPSNEVTATTLSPAAIARHNRNRTRRTIRGQVN